MVETKPFAEFLINSFDDFESRYLTIQQNRNLKDAVYRGQTSSDWGLIPPIFRDASNTSSISFDWIKNKISEEYQNVRYFVQQADEIGFDLPGEIFQILNLKNLDAFGFSNWYPMFANKNIELIALAQHHGAKTRFLDFSFNAYVALYFAAEGAIEKLLENKEKAETLNFSLWMIDRMYLYFPECNLEDVIIPKAKNEYLYAQKGHFWGLPLPTSIGANIQTSDLDLKEVAVKNCYEMAANAPGVKNIWPVIYKFIKNGVKSTSDNTL